MINRILVISFSALLMQGCMKGMGSHAEAPKPQVKEKKVVTGQSTAKLPVGKNYAATPPKLVREEVTWNDKQVAQTVAWDNTKRFGPVPAALVEEGMKTCRAVGGNRARGYHPNALGVNGKPIPGGGFLCS